MGSASLRPIQARQSCAQGRIWNHLETSLHRLSSFPLPVAEKWPSVTDSSGTFSPYQPSAVNVGAGRAGAPQAGRPAGAPGAEGGGGLPSPPAGRGFRKQPSWGGGVRQAPRRLCPQRATREGLTSLGVDGREALTAPLGRWRRLYS